MKHHTGLTSFCLLLAVLLMSSSLRAAFLVDVHINSAEAPSLSFGENDTDITLADLFPAPPFSGMFGVVDLYFENNQDAFKNEPWYDRLSTDRKKSGSANQWILIANSKAKLTWKLKSGSLPANLNIAWLDDKTQTVKFEAILADASFNVKPGTTYTIQTIETPAAGDLGESSDDSTGYARKVDGQINPVVFNFSPAGADPQYILRLTFNAGIDQIRYAGEAGKPDALWEVSFTAPGYTPAYAWDITDPTILIITLTQNNSRAEGDWLISLAPQKTSASPIEIFETSELLGIEMTLRAIMLKFGTLDFDDDEMITADDVMYLYNWVSLGSPTSADSWFTADMLAGYTENATPEKLTAAWNYFQGNTDELKFDGDNVLTADNVMYLYNYVSLGCPAASDDWFTADMLSGYTENPTPEKLQNAKQTLQEYAEQ